MRNTVFDLHRPHSRDTSVIFASPHSGRDYAGTVAGQSILNDDQLRSSEDAFVDLLFDRVPEFGAPLITATAPRAFVDLNRDETELDSALIVGVKRNAGNPRVASGLGVIPRVVANAMPIYVGKMQLTEAQSRISNYWRPYHTALQTLMAESSEQFGQAILIDCHSMPTAALGGLRDDRSDVVLGDRFGAGASSHIVDQIEAAFTDAGFRVARNIPFAGAYIVGRYGRPSRNCHAIQVEIDRSLYMDEFSLTPHDGYADTRERLMRVAGKITEIGRTGAVKLAAE